MLSCENARADPYRIDTTATTIISSWKCCEACGMIGSTILRKPYAPTFESTPDSKTRTGIGVDVYASGIHPCSGKAGIFTRNAAANRKKIQYCDPAETWRAARSLNS